MQTFGCLHDKGSKLSQARSSKQAGIDFLILSIRGSGRSAGSSVLSCGASLGNADLCRERGEKKQKPWL